MTALRSHRFRLGCAAFALLLTTFLLPKIPLARPIYDAVLVMDITGSMQVRDQQEGGQAISRLALEKLAARRLLAAMPCGSRLGVAIFAERRPFLLFEPAETCANFTVLDDEISRIDWRMGWDSESHIAFGVVAAMRMANSLGADLIFLTDGQEMPPLSWTGAPNFSPVRFTTKGLLAGIGGRSLVPIPKFDRFGREIGVWKPGELPGETGGLFAGHEHLSAVDEQHLHDVAAQTGLTYLHLENPDALLPALSQAASPRARPGFWDVRFVPATLALLLLGLADVTMPWRAGSRVRVAASGLPRRDPHAT